MGNNDGQLVVNSAGGKKFDGGKIDWTLVPWKELEDVVRVLDHGAKKYGRNNWRKVEVDRYKAALMRHIIAYLNGEVVDSDSGIHHLAHAVCNCLFIMYLEKNNTN